MYKRQEARHSSFRICRLQHIAALGLPLIEPEIYSQYYHTPELLKSLGDWYFPDPTVFLHEKRTEIADTMTSAVRSKAQESIDAAALIFAHSVLDDFATALCKAIAIADPTCWETAILDKRIALTEMRQSTFESLYNDALNKYLRGLGRQESLTKRIDLIHQKCPPSNVPPSRRGAYKYDPEDPERYETLMPADKILSIVSDGRALVGELTRMLIISILLASICADLLAGHTNCKWMRNHYCPRRLRTTGKRCRV